MEFQTSEVKRVQPAGEMCIDTSIIDVPSLLEANITGTFLSLLKKVAKAEFI